MQDTTVKKLCGDFEKNFAKQKNGGFLWKLTMLKGKVHRAVVKQAELNYVGMYNDRSGADGCGWDLRI